MAAVPHVANTYLERVDFGYRLPAAILLVVVCEEYDVFAHPLHIGVGLYDFVVLQLRVQDRSVKGNIEDGVSLAEVKSYRMW